MIRSGPSWFQRPGGMTNDVGNVFGGGSNPGTGTKSAGGHPAMRRPMHSMGGGGGMRPSPAPSPMPSPGPSYRPSGPVSTAPSNSGMAGGIKSPWKNGGGSPGFNFADPEASARTMAAAMPSTPISGGMVASNAPDMFAGPSPYGNDAFVGVPSGNSPMDELTRRMGGNSGVNPRYGKGVGVAQYY